MVQVLQLVLKNAISVIILDARSVIRFLLLVQNVKMVTIIILIAHNV